MTRVVQVVVVGLLFMAAGPVDAGGKDKAAKEKMGSAAMAPVLMVPSDVKWGPAPDVLPPGAQFAVIEGDVKAEGKLFTFRAKLPDGYTIPAHFHPADEHITIIKGTFHLGMGDRFDRAETRALVVGSFAVMPKGHHHFAQAEGETIVQIHAVGPWGLTYVNPADDPRNKMKTGSRLP